MAGFKRFLFLIDADLSEGSLEWIEQNSEDFLRGFPLQNGKSYLLAKNQILFFNKVPGVNLLVQPIAQSPENIKYLHQQLIKNSEPENSTLYAVTEPTWFAKGVGALGSYETHSPNEIRYELLKSSAKQVNFSQRQLSVEDSKALVSILDIASFNLNEVDVSVSDFQTQIEKTDKAVLIDISAYKNLLDKINQSISRLEAFNSDALKPLKENKVKLEEYIEKANSHNKLANLINLDLSNFERAIFSLRALVTNVDTSIEEQLKKKKEIKIPPQLEQLGYSQSVVSEYTEPLRRQSRIRELNRHFKLLESFESLNQEKTNLRTLINNHNELVKIYDNISTKINGWKENPEDDELNKYIDELKVIKSETDSTSLCMDFRGDKCSVNSFIEEIKNLAKEAETKLDNIIFSKNISDVKNALDKFPDSENLLNVSLQEVEEKIKEINSLKNDLQIIKKDAQKIGQSCKDVNTQIDRVEGMSHKLKEVKKLKEKEVNFEKLSSNQPYLTEDNINKILEKIDEIERDFDNIKGLSPIEFKKGKSAKIFNSMKEDLNTLKSELYVMKLNSKSLEINGDTLKNKLNEYIEKTEKNIQQLEEHNKDKKNNPLIVLFENFIYKIKVNIHKQCRNSLRLFKAYPEAKAAEKVEKNPEYVPKRQQRLKAGEYAISIFKQPSCERKDEFVKLGNAPTPAA